MLRKDVGYSHYRLRQNIRKLDATMMTNMRATSEYTRASGRGKKTKTIAAIANMGIAVAMPAIGFLLLTKEARSQSPAAVPAIDA